MNIKIQWPTVVSQEETEKINVQSDYPEQWVDFKKIVVMEVQLKQSDRPEP